MELDIVLPLEVMTAVMVFIGLELKWIPIGIVIKDKKEPHGLSAKHQTHYMPAEEAEALVLVALAAVEQAA